MDVDNSFVFDKYRFQSEIDKGLTNDASDRRWKWNCGSTFDCVVFYRSLQGEDFKDECTIVVKECVIGFFRYVSFKLDLRSIGISGICRTIRDWWRMVGDMGCMYTICVYAVIYMCIADMVGCKTGIKGNGDVYPIEIIGAQCIRGSF